MALKEDAVRWEAQKGWRALRQRGGSMSGGACTKTEPICKAAADFSKLPRSRRKRDCCPTKRAAVSDDFQLFSAGDAYDDRPKCCAMYVLTFDIVEGSTTPMRLISRFDRSS